MIIVLSHLPDAVQQMKTETMDIEVSDTLTAQDLFKAINSIFELNIDERDSSKHILFSLNPMNLLHGDRTLKEFGIHEGSMIYIPSKNV